MLTIFRQVRCKYAGVLQYVCFQHQTPREDWLCSLDNSKLQVVPSRGMRGMRSSILHKEVIEKYREKQQNQDNEDKALSFETTVKDDDMPVQGLPNPYEKPPKKCILCEHDVPLDYKNTRLLSQFVSPHSGKIYGRHITGLCLYMQRRVATLIKRSRYFGLMPYELKDPRYLRDPKLFDPFRRH